MKKHKLSKPIQKIVDIAETYMAEHEGELPIIVHAHGLDEDRIIVGQFREKHSQDDEKTFRNVLRLAFAIYGYTHYEFITKPTFNYVEMEMTKDVFAVGKISPTEKTVEFFEIDDEKLVPYFNEMPIGGPLTQVLPTQSEIDKQYDAKVLKGIQTYIENCTYRLPHKAEEIEIEDKSGIEALRQAMAS